MNSFAGLKIKLRPLLLLSPFHCCPGIFQISRLSLLPEDVMACLFRLSSSEQNDPGRHTNKEYHLCLAGGKRGANEPMRMSVVPLLPHMHTHTQTQTHTHTLATGSPHLSHDERKEGSWLLKLQQGSEATP